ncbi:hypothetical protein [Mycobacterium sp.]
MRTDDPRRRNRGLADPLLPFNYAEQVIARIGNPGKEEVVS